ncbi:MAG: hypothetical protein ABL994_25650, partial [Verrucomicrobiales bacterium]
MFALVGVLAVLAYVFFQLNYHNSLGKNPRAQPYSFLTHTFSHLGSFDSHRNPGGWLFFSACMVVIALGSVPLNAYIFRRLRVIDQIGAGYGSFLLALG